MNLIYFKNQKGFVILFTILISAIILLMGAGIFSIASRETVLSSTSREAQSAFYSADAGVECALYAESKGLFTNGGITNTPIPCGNGNPIINVILGGNGVTFDVAIDSTLKTCAHVSVFTIGNERRVVSQGYNVCNGDKPATNNPILVERVLDTKYAIGGGALVPQVSNTPPIGGVGGVNPSILQNGTTINTSGAQLQQTLGNTVTTSGGQ